jgi:hypothetical protein
MKRTVAFLAAVCVSTGFLFVTQASAQYSPPKSPPPTQPPTQPAESPEDTLKTKGESPAAPATPKATTNTAQPAAAIDTVAAATRNRRRHTPTNQRTFVLSLGLGAGLNYKPQEFKDDFSPSFGGVLAFGVRQYGFTAGVNIGYNFYLSQNSSQAAIPNDLNILTIFGEIKYGPTHNIARPYLVVCGGYFRQWVVNLDYTENVLGYGGGAGVDVEIDRVRRLFFDARYIEGQTRKTPEQANTAIIPFRLGISWEFR